MSEQVLVPKILWAERKDYLYITIELQDVEDPKFDVQTNKFTFEGHVRNPQNKDDERLFYRADVELNGEIDVENSTYRVLPRQIEMKLKKKEEGYWNKLHKGPKTDKIAIDWSKWVDEDEDQTADFGGFGGDFNFGNLGGLGGLGGMGGLGDLGGMGDLSEMMKGLGGDQGP